MMREQLETAKEDCREFLVLCFLFWHFVSSSAGRRPYSSGGSKGDARPAQVCDDGSEEECGYLLNVSGFQSHLMVKCGFICW